MNPADHIQQLAGLLDGTSIGLLELTTPEGLVRLRRDAGPRDPVDAESLTIRAPSVGTFRIAHPMLVIPLAEPGRSVMAGEAVGLIQVGTLLLHVRAPADGVLQDILAADGDTVGYGAKLMHLTAANA